MNLSAPWRRSKAERWEKFGSHSYLLEPHIKEGKGGLRDIQAMFWVAKGVFGLRDTEAMQSSGLLAAANRKAFGSFLVHAGPDQNGLASCWAGAKTIT
jgi:UTP:GlnB (protein PII) uridylyltransferase